METATHFTATLVYDDSADTTPEGVDPKLWKAFEEARISLRTAKRLGIV